MLGVALVAMAVVIAVAAFALTRPSGDVPESGPTQSVTVTPTEDVPKAVELPKTGVAIAVPGVGMVASLDPIVFSGSVLNPPDDVRRAGIWADGAPLAAEGVKPTVITGHVSDGRDRAGAFKKILDMKVGMTAVTRDADGQLRHWKVAKLHHYNKSDLPRSIFLAGNERVLRLITCADRIVYPNGRFHYEDNFVVELLPVPST